MAGKHSGDESPRTVLCDDSLRQRPALFTGDALQPMLPALEGCPARSPQRQRVGVDSDGEEGLSPLDSTDSWHLENFNPNLLPTLDGWPARSAKRRRVGLDLGEEERAVNPEDSASEMLANDSAPDLLPTLEGWPARRAKRRRVGLDLGEEERAANPEHSASEMLANDSAPDLLATLEGCPGRSTKRRRVGLDSGSAQEFFPAAKAKSSYELQEVQFDNLPDEVIIAILGCSDQRGRTVISTVCKNLRSVIKRNSSPCCGRFSSTPECQLYSTASRTNLTNISSLGRDVLLKILCKLTSSDIARLGRTCAGFRCPLACVESRRFIRKYNERCELLGALVSCPALSKYPMLLSSLLPRQQQRLVSIFARFWRTFAMDNRLGKIELGDCRDGRIVLREGKSDVCTKIIICNPFTVNRPGAILRELPFTLIQETSSYVCCTFLPHDDGQNFSVIVIMSSTSTSPDKSIKIVKYISEVDCWSSKQYMWDSEVPSRSTVRLPSVLSENKIHYLQQSVKILTVDAELNIGAIPIPDLSGISLYNHILVEQKSGILCLVFVIGRKIKVFEFISSCSAWNLSKEFEGPGEESDCRLVGSGTDKILIHASDRLCSMDLTNGRCFDVSIGSKFVREAFCYELQDPPVAEFFWRLH